MVEEEVEKDKKEEYEEDMVSIIVVEREGWR